MISSNRNPAVPLPLSCVETCTAVKFWHVYNKQPDVQESHWISWKWSLKLLFYRSCQKKETAMDNRDVMHALKLIVVCMMWYASSASGNVIGKLVLNEFPYPMTMTMVQLVSAAVYLGPILKIMGVPIAGEISSQYYWRMIVPLAFGKFVSSVSSHVSIWKVSVSYAHTGILLLR